MFTETAWEDGDTRRSTPLHPGHRPPRRGEETLVARFGGIPLIRQRAEVRTDIRPVMASMSNELTTVSSPSTARSGRRGRTLRSTTSANSLISTDPDAGRGPRGSI